MMSGAFVGFQTTEREWSASYAKDLFKAYDEWNTKWENGES